ncbi:MAG: protein translocase subunit SecD [Campylobacterales bacterium]
MKRSWRFSLFVIVTLIGFFLSLPSFLQTKEGVKITLGLDLQGGLYLLLGVKSDEAVVSKIKTLASELSYYCEKEEVLVEKILPSATSLQIHLIDGDDVAKVKEHLAKTEGLDIRVNGLVIEAALTPAEIAKIKEQAVNQAVETIRNRLDQFGLAEPMVARAGDEKIHIELPGIKTQADEQRIRDLIARTAHLQMMAVDEEHIDRLPVMTPEEAASYHDVIYPDYKNPQIRYLLKEIPILDGSKLIDARVGYDQNNQPVINFTLNTIGGEIFGDFSGKNVGKRLAIVLDGKVYSAPVIRERIGGGSGQISGSYTVEEASDLAIALRSGALLAPVEVLEKRSVGPSLGADSIMNGLIAFISGLVLVVAFMALYYRLAGVVANVAVLANIVLLVAVMALFGATLTLPGMAGIVLIVGMAVDANVIINERIRELLREGVAVRKAIEGGYENAMSALVDANLTTLIAAIALYTYGTGPIKGFAITLGIGILVSMFTAILGTRGIFEVLMPKIEKSRNMQAWFGITLPGKRA